MTFAEKMFAKASGKGIVRAGDIVYPDPELIIVHDAYLEAAYRELSKIGYARITHPEKLMVVTDHEVVYTTPQSVERSRANRRIVKIWEAGHFYDAGRGGHGHIFPMETGAVRPAAFVAAYDMHCSNFGAIGAYALATGPDITVMLATGSMWVCVPSTIIVELQGEIPAGVQARDIGFRLARDLMDNRYGLSWDGAVVEFQGASIDQIPVAARVGLINSLTEIGVVHVLFPPMDTNNRPIVELTSLVSDSHAQIAGRIVINLGEASPQIALTGSPSNAVDIETLAGQRIDHAYIGACGSSHYEDFAAAADVMQGRPVADGVRLFVVPGTVETAKRMMKDGLTQRFLDAGAIVLPPGCGPCAGGATGAVGPNEVSLSTAATNGPGRMGASDAQYFLGSPLTVAAAAVAGHIVDPRGVSLTG
jgi:3-isopropylmalate/(R)-2-methylmalate dehydratase large subunit